MKEPREIIHKPAAERLELEQSIDPRVSSPTGGYGTYHDLNAADGMQLMDYWRAIRKRLWLVIGVVVLITTATAIYMSRRPNIYQARAQVQVDLEQSNPDLVTTADRRTGVYNSD